METSRLIGIFTAIVMATVFHVQPSYQDCDQNLINNAMDFVLEQSVAKFANNISLPNVSMPFTGGKLELNSGHVLGIDTLQRVGDVVFNVTDDEMHIALELTFENFTIAFDEYKIDAMLIHSQGTWSASILENLIRIEVTMEEKSHCFLKVDKIEFKKLSNFTMDLKSGCAWCDSVTNWASTATLNMLSNKLKTMVQDKLDSSIREFLKPNEESMVCNGMARRKK